MNKPDLQALLPQVEDIARLAGAEIMKFYAGTDVIIKDDGSEVTAADHAAENVILPALAALTPNIPIVSEERFAAGDAPDVSGGTFWTVDPLDGTKEFINKTGAFVVAIALVVDNKAAMGIIYHPAKGLLYSAAGIGTATKTGPDGVRHSIGKNTPQQGNLHVLVNEPHADMPRIKGWLGAQFKKASDIDPKSGIFRPCQIAEGLADMAVFCSAKRQGRIKWWDVAPGHAILEAAGGTAETLEGGPLLYDAPDYQVAPHAFKSAGMSRKPTPPAPPTP